MTSPPRCRWARASCRRHGAAPAGPGRGTRTSFELAAGEALGERNADMQQWVARKLLNELGDPDEKYNVGDVVQFPTPDGLGSYAVRAAGA